MRVILTTNALDIIEEFEQLDEDLKSQMRLAMFRALSILKAETQQNIRSNSGLNVRTGTLLNSITTETIDRGLTIEGRLGPSNVPYAAIHELGGELPARFIKPRLKKALSFSGAGGKVFSSGHWMPAIKIPARPYLAPAVQKHVDNIAQIFSIFVEDAFDMNNEG